MFGKVRKTRSDCTVGTYEKKHDLPTGTIRNKDGRKELKVQLNESQRKWERLSLINRSLVNNAPP